VKKLLDLAALQLAFHPLDDILVLIREHDRSTARQELQEHDAEAVDVGSCSDMVALGET
jgi:hypothetical protein